uniref:Uncharacterized protein n=1 Tax=Oryza brachyantha TaxID=4533 RepID=J3MF40_ORYBR
MAMHHHLSGAGAAAGGAAPPIVRFPRWTAGRPGLLAAGVRPIRRLKLAARPPAATTTTAGSPGPWFEPNDDTKVNVFKIIYHSASEALELMEQNTPRPRPPLDVAQMRKLFKDQLVQSASANATVSIIHSLLLSHWHMWNTYANVPIKEYNGRDMFLRDCAKSAYGNDGRIRDELLSTFDLSMDSMPTDDFDKDLIAAILYVSKVTWKYVGEYRERLLEQQPWNIYMDKVTEESEDDEDVDFPELGAGGI